MASSSASLLHSSLAIHRRRYPPLAIHRRHLSLLILSSPAVMSSLSFNSASRAEDIPIFGLRNKIQKVEEAAAEIVKEGEEAVEEKIEAVEEGIEAVAEGIELGFGGGLVQAAVVAGAEAVGVLVGVSIVNGILGPEGKKL